MRRREERRVSTEQFIVEIVFTGVVRSLLFSGAIIVTRT